MAFEISGMVIGFIRPGSEPNSGIFSRRYIFKDSKGALWSNAPISA